MTEPTPDPTIARIIDSAPALAPPHRSAAFRHFVVAFVFGLLIAAACRLTAGVSLGTFFGPILLAALVAPQLAAGAPRASLPIWAGVTLAVTGVWLVAARIELSSVLGCSCILAAWMFALCGTSSLLTRGRIPSALAAAAVSVVALAWLTWPVWLSAWLPTPGGGAVIHWAGPLNPLLAVNRILKPRFDQWDRYRLAYQQLTSLNQDVLYALPSTLWPSVIAHFAMGLVATLVSRPTIRSSHADAIDVSSRPG